MRNFFDMEQDFFINESSDIHYDLGNDVCDKLYSSDIIYDILGLSIEESGHKLLK
jgi:hypothetical protein